MRRTSLSAWAITFSVMLAIGLVVAVQAQDTTTNLPPVAALDYSWDGYKYYFYSDNCYDPDGIIVKYQYTILREALDNTYEYVDSYACCLDVNCNPPPDSPIAALCGKQGAECAAPAPSSGFSLFYTCPYISYQFEVPEEGATYRVELTVWDNEGAQSDNAWADIRFIAPGTGDSNAMYVWGMNAKKKSTGSGSTLTLTVTVQRDSNKNGQSDSNDRTVQGALVRMELLKDTGAQPDGNFDARDMNFNRSIPPVTTNRYGQAIFVIKGLPPGDYRAQAEPTHPNYVWNGQHDIGNPRDVTIWW